MLTVRNIIKKYDYKIVFTDVSFSLERGQRMALVGPNGIGKTTLLRIIAKEEEQDVGTIEMHPGLRIAYVPQDMTARGRKTVRSYIDMHAGFNVPTHEIETICAGFGMSISLDNTISTLSGGQKRKVALMGALLSRADLFLLDEPTNDLDMEALIWLEEYIVRTQMTALIVSHDRTFLDTVTDRILALDAHTRTATMVRGKYSNYLKDIEKQEERQRIQYAVQMAKIDQLEKVVKDKQHAAKEGAKWQGTDNDKILRGFKRNRAGKSGRTAKVTIRRIERIDRIEAPPQKISLVIALESLQEKGVADIVLTKAVLGYDTFVTEPVTLAIPYGSRVGFVGKNGSGKSTILRAIAGMITPQSGLVERGAGVRIGNLTQEHEHLPVRTSPLVYMKRETTLRESQIFNLLKKFGIDDRQIKQPIGMLSPGVKTRLLLARFSAQSVNILLLDEPTNHLDIEAVQALENLLATYEGTVILVTHDRALLEHAKLQTVYRVAEGKVKKIKNYEVYALEAQTQAKKMMRLL